MDKRIDRVILNNLSYFTAVNITDFSEGSGKVFLYKPDRKEIHFMIKDDYYILDKDNKVVINSKDVYLHDNDWQQIKISTDVKFLVEDLIAKYHKPEKKKKKFNFFKRRNSKK